MNAAMHPRRCRTLSLLIPMALVLLAAHLLPADAIGRFPFLGRIAGSVGAWFPYMGEYAAASAWPQLSYAMLALSLPLSLPAGLSYAYWHLQVADLDRGRTSFNFLAWGWTALLFMAFPLVLPGPDFEGRSALGDWMFTQTRTGLGILCCMLVAMEALLVMVLLGWWRALRTRHEVRTGRPRNARGE